MCLHCVAELEQHEVHCGWCLSMQRPQSQHVHWYFPGNSGLDGLKGRGTRETVGNCIWIVLTVRTSGAMEQPKLVHQRPILTKKEIYLPYIVGAGATWDEARPLQLLSTGKGIGRPALHASHTMHGYTRAAALWCCQTAGICKLHYAWSWMQFSTKILN